MKKKHVGMSLLEFQERFATEKDCREYLIQTRWPKGFVCRCGSNHHCYSPARGEFHCYECDRVTSPNSGTLFHKSKVPLRKWFWAIFLVATSQKGVSALYLQRELKVSYPTAWAMLRKIRLAMAQRDEQWSLKGSIAADEIFIGGKQSLEQRRKRSNKTPFFIALEENHLGRPKFLGAKEIESAYDGDSLGSAVDEMIPNGMGPL